MAMGDTRNHLRKVAEGANWMRGSVPGNNGSNESDVFTRGEDERVRVYYARRGSKWVLQTVQYREDGQMLQMAGNLKAERVVNMLDTVAVQPTVSEYTGKLDSDGTFTEDDQGNWHEVPSREPGSVMKIDGEELRTACGHSFVTCHTDHCFRAPQSPAPGMLPAMAPEYRIYGPSPAQDRWVPYAAVTSETEARDILARQRAEGSIRRAARVDITELDW